MLDLVIGLLTFTTIYTPIDNVTIGFGINEDSNIYVNNSLANDDVEVFLSFDIYVDWQTYGHIETSSVAHLIFNALDYIVLDVGHFSVINNYAELAGEVIYVLKNGDEVYDQIYGTLNLFEDFVFQDDIDFGSFATDIYRSNNFNNIYDLGYNTGYDDGKIEGQGVNNVITWFGSIWDGLAKILALEIAPNLTIGTIITIPIVIAVLFFGLKALIQ